MPVRDNLRSAGSDQTDLTTGVLTQHYIGKTLGFKQSISALNNAGKFVPGQFRANAVVIERINAIGTPARSTGTDIYLSNRGKIEGHICAHILNAMNMSPTSNSYPGYYGIWNSVAAGHSVQKAYASMNEADLDVGVMLGELRETIAGLANPLSALKSYAKLANRLKRQGKSPKGSDTLGMLSGSWLEWRYGIQPLIFTISDIIEHVQTKSLSLQGKILRERGKVRYTRDYVLSGGQYPGRYYVTGDIRVKVDTKYVTKVFYKLTRPLSWQEQYGVDASSLPGIAWELATLSFVWDWFFSVGDWIGSLKTSDARSVLGSVTSQKCTVVAEVKPKQPLFMGIVPARCTPGSLRVTYEKLDRRINQPQPLGPVVNRESLSLKRKIDAISLLWQSMPKIRR